MKKYLSSVLAAAISALLLTPASAEHEWGIDKSTATWGLSNDLWRVDGSFNNNCLSISTITPTASNPDPTTLDISGLHGFIYNSKPLNQIQCWANSPTCAGIKSLVISDQTYTSFVCRNSQMPDLEEVRTTNADFPHRFSINTLAQGALNCSKLEGDYEFVDVSSIVKEAFNGVNASSFKLSGSFSKLETKTFFMSHKIKSVDLVTSGVITSLPDYLAGDWGDKSAPADPVQLASFTLNGAPLLRASSIVSIGQHSMPHCAMLTDIIDLPYCTSIGNYGLRGNSSIPFVNLMGVTTLSRAALREFASADRVVLGDKGPLTIGIELFYGSFVNSLSPSVIWNSTTVPSGSIVESTFGGIGDNHLTNYVRKEARAGWDSALASQPKIKQNFVSMDTVFKVNLRLGDQVVMTTLMPGVSGENSVWTIPASWFLAAGQTFGEGVVKDDGGTVIGDATAIPDGTGLNLTITLPASCVESADGTTQEAEVFVDMVAQENKDPQISVKIVGADNVTIVEDSFEATVGTSVTKDYGANVLGNDAYYFNNVLSLAVDPVDATTAAFGLDAKLTLENIAKDAEITVKIDRAARPMQLAYWNVDTTNYTMSDGVWTFRCDFTGGKAVIADAIRYNGADYDVVEVDFTKPIGTDGSSDYQVTTLDWGATIDGSAVSITDKNSCGKNVVINGGAGTAATLVGTLKIPATVDTISGWGYCANLTIDSASLAQISKFGKYALARTSISGAITLSAAFPVDIGDYAFEMCSKLTALKVPSLGSTIGEKGFYHCNGMKTIELDGVTSIKWAAFSRDNSGTWAIEKVVLSPALTNLGINAFYKSVKSGCIFDAVSPRDMPAAKSGDGVIAANVFQDIGANSIVIPFKGTCTMGDGAFHFSMTTNFIFWGKAPANWAHEAGAEFSENVSKIFRTQFNGNVKTDRMFTVSLTMDKAGWESVATKLKKDCTDGEWTALNPPATAFGWVMVSDKTDGTNQKRIWLCEGTSPWESVSSRGLLILVR